MEEEVIAKRDFIKNLLEEQLSSFDDKRKYNRRKSIRSHRVITLIGALITIFSGINVDCLEGTICLNDITRFIILVFGATITAIGAYKTFFNNRDLWVKYTMTTNSLKKIKSDFDYYLAGKNEKNINKEDIDIFKKRIQEVLDNSNGSWETFMDVK
ncbi:DUF4231 domain-containing protein [Aquimarina sp. 2201CG5-10]|uniref:DUF4231 domain-containing protein n=1 Tax=Aquimarina callyspongiae TaxID=3098150 RepID=UPI002AB49DF9|nr:DUF4231 domain-containing protein [Aquimarina sp. 2201CG5-10]MDY8138136.1 DUF4231 domain-containing protein [Aquimarina sp. 2201CG5-10]